MLHLGYVQYKRNKGDEWQDGLGVFKSPGVSDINHILTKSGQVYDGDIWDYRPLTHMPITVESGCASFNFDR